MHRDYPLQRHARHRLETLQPAFIQRAKCVLETLDECLLEESQDGLTLLAPNEEALEAPVGVLREAFGAVLEWSPLEVRLIGAPPRAPIMHVRVNVPAFREEPAKRVLRRRSVAIFEESRGGTRCLLLGEAPLANLLGMGSDLKSVTLGRSLLWTRLARYGTCSPDPDPAAA